MKINQIVSHVKTGSTHQEKLVKVVIQNVKLVKDQLKIVNHVKLTLP